MKKFLAILLVVAFAAGIVLFGAGHVVAEVSAGRLRRLRKQCRR